MGERSWRPGKNLSKCCLWGMGGSREQRKRKPESDASREGTGLGVISRVGSHKSRLRKRQMVTFTAHFLREGVSLGLSWGAELGVLERRR